MIMKHTVEEAARIEREKILQELKDGYSKHKDTSLYNAFAATIEKYAVPLFKDGAEWQSKQSPWISVKERLPEEEQKIFVLTMGYGVPYIQKETFRRSNNLDIKGIWTHGNSIVLAWLPIPSFDDILKNNNKK